MSSCFNKQQTPFCPNPTRPGGFWLGGIISGKYALCYLSQLFLETGGIINLVYTQDRAVKLHPQGHTATK